MTGLHLTLSDPTPGRRCAAGYFSDWNGSPELIDAAILRNMEIVGVGVVGSRQREGGVVCCNAVST